VEPDLKGIRVKSRLAICTEKLSEVEQHLAELYGAADAKDRLKIAEGLSLIRAALKAVKDTSMAIEHLPEEEIRIKGSSND
jgi:hypothetical protein